MQIVRDREELARAREVLRGPVALVPTMGALHDGHMALVTEAKARAEAVIATIFVNPLQFNDAKDLELYPRSEHDDLAKLEAAGCYCVWLPGVDDIYPHGFATTVRVAGVSDRWEGEHRPGHFDGVATVVAKLLIATRPDIAIFGEKDWQQLAVIRRLTDDLGIGADIIGHPIVREADGLAMSSRNARLSVEERSIALALPRALEGARDSIQSGGSVRDALAKAVGMLETAGFEPIDYVALVDGASLEPIEEPRSGARLIAAATLGRTRLIDNFPL